MKRFLSLTITACGLAVSAHAAAICASPQELKVLQAAVLQQQLMAAVQSCRFGADYNRFVAAYGAAIVQSDRALQDFFRRNKGAEGYGAYKARIAKAASLKSLHDPRFCASAKAVFDVALGRGEGKKTPGLIATGYETCRAVAAKPVMAAKPVPWALRLAAIPKPAPRPAASVAPAVPNEKPVIRLAAALPPPQRPLPAVAPPFDKKLPSAAMLASHAPAVAEPPEVVGQALRTVAAQQPQRRNPDWGPGDPYAGGGNIPNAYQPGAYWVHNQAPPPRRRPHDHWTLLFAWPG
jgi:hypothetical protein